MIAPRTGGVDATTHQPEREVFPSYAKQLFGFYEHPGEEIGNKESFWLKLAEQLESGKDWRGDPITKSTDSTLQALQQYLSFIAQQWLPISMSNPAKKGTKIGSVERFFGMAPAPGYLTAPTQYENMMKRLGIKADRTKQRHDITQKAREQ